MNSEQAGHGQTQLLFQNVSERRLTLEDVFQRMQAFMHKDPKGVYRFVVGTDCQANARSTTFVTGIVIHRLGRGAWACYRKTVVPTRIYSIGQKLSMETSMSQETVAEFGTARLLALEDIVLPYVYQGASFSAFVDIDAGTDEFHNKTAPFVAEMVSRVESMGLTARVKPEAVIASSYANRYTKSRSRSRIKGG
ncbi:MAG: hypothetical protein K0R57_2332 [Paenibacillaceae bacterium]|jgi:predicted RNase H-related nuclease YkuK (DUF458 family)|nr:hypothetical protein [Paenibacillaceae bacterium]